MTKKLSVRLCEKELGGTSILELMALVILNYLIGNNDAHAKNFSLPHLSQDKVIFAPAYDLLCTRIYDLEDSMAMAIGGESHHQLVRKHHWEKLAKSVDYSFKGLQNLAKKTTSDLIRCSPKIKQQMTDDGSFRPVVDRISEQIKSNSEALTRSLDL